MGKEWTAEQRVAFGEKMAAARAAKKTTEVSDVATAKTEKVFAGPDDVPAGVRPIKARPAVTGREVDPAAVAGLQQAPDTGFAAADTGRGLEVSGDVLGGGNNGGGRASAGIPAGQTKREGSASAILFSDKKEDGGLPAQMQRSRGRTGPAEPTGLPCECAMPTKLRGQSRDITWCAICGGERDRVARPENALKATSAQHAIQNAGVVLNPDAIAQRVLGLIDYDAIAAAVVAQLKHNEDVRQ